MSGWRRRSDGGRIAQPAGSARGHGPADERRALDDPRDDHRCNKKRKSLRRLDRAVAEDGGKRTVVGIGIRRLDDVGADAAFLRVLENVDRRNHRPEQDEQTDHPLGTRQPHGARVAWKIFRREEFHAARRRNPASSFARAAPVCYRYVVVSVPLRLARASLTLAVLVAWVFQAGCGVLHCATETKTSNAAPHCHGGDGADDHDKPTHGSPSAKDACCRIQPADRTVPSSLAAPQFPALRFEAVELPEPGSRIEPVGATLAARDDVSPPGLIVPLRI